MVVDDQEGMLTVTTEALQARGFQATSAASATEALDQFKAALDNGKPPPSVVVTDLRMPEISGTELAAQIKRLAPDTRVVLLSGYLDESPADNDPNIDVAVNKPFDLRQLAKLIRELLDGQV
jgi:CheY-like chemotaxis protein